MKTSKMSRGRLSWYLMTIALLAVTLITVAGPLGDSNWNQPNILFLLVVTGSAICIAAATTAIAFADRRELAEYGLLGAGLMGASVMPLVHGLTTPGVIYNETAAFDTAAFLSLPVALAACAPLLRPHSPFGRWAARRWRDWTLLSLLAVFILGGVVVSFPDTIVMPGAGNTFTILVTVGLIVAFGSFSLRQLRFFELGGRSANMTASISLLMVSMLALIPLSSEPYSATFWWLHLAGALGVVGASASMMFSKHMSRSAQDILAPVLVRDPLIAFELGLSPIVHNFVASLEVKDEITRDHTIRTGEMAMRVGERFSLSGRRLRNLGLAAMLHDVGKLNTPDEILKKPSRLTTDEYEVIKLHAEDGAEMFAAEPTLAGAAYIVRSHHERIDGAGYPDGLVAREIPLESRIIAVCDALDAMTNDRLYRKAMPVSMAFAVLREHSGSQWDPEVVAQAMSVYPTMPVAGALDHVGRDLTGAPSVDMSNNVENVLVEANIPADVGELLRTVDAEI